MQMLKPDFDYEHRRGTFRLGELHGENCSITVTKQQAGGMNFVNE